ncbi:MAG TPA: excalibur calcium-binding domain-containing protein [Nakamurella sp.]
MGTAIGGSQTPAPVAAAGPVVTDEPAASSSPTSTSPTSTSSSATPSSATPTTDTSPRTTSGSPVTQAGYVVTSVVDGDTVRVRPAGSGSELRVRLIGIDAPETGSCEASAATAALEALALDRTVTLTMGGDGEDLDPYGRALRYLDTTEGDAGLAMITGGHAIARFDSRDGYGRHDREPTYVAADATSPTVVCPPPAPIATRTFEDPVTVAPIPTQDDGPDVRADRGSTTTTQQPAAASYPNCAAAKAAGAAPLYAGGPGYSTKLDRDRDGVACE